MVIVVTCLNTTLTSCHRAEKSPSCSFFSFALFQDEFIVSFQSCNNEQTSLQVEITANHPFYVKGKDGEFWASVNPCSSESHHGISCQPLECGDVCMLPYARDVVGYLNGTQWDTDKTS